MGELPEELLQQVFIHLRPSGFIDGNPTETRKLQTLLDISLASKAFNRIVRPFIFHTLSPSTQRKSCLPSLLRTLIERPGTADLVKHLYLSDWETQLGVEHGFARPVVPDAEAIERYDRTLDSIVLRSDLQQRLRDRLSEGLQDAAVALLICICNKLSMLDITFTYGWESSLVGAIFEAYSAAQGSADAISSGPAMSSESSASHTGTHSVSFESLREVKVEPFCEESSMTIADVSSFLRLPALRNFEGRNLISVYHTDLSQLRSSVQAVYLKECVTDGHNLKELFGACPALETLSLHGMTDFEPWAHDGEVTYRAWGKVLESCGSRLKRLSLRIDDRGNVDDSWLDGIPLGSLVHLSSLEHLEAPVEALCGHRRICQEDDDTGPDFWDSEKYLASILPKSLKTLQLFWTYMDDDDFQTRDTQLLKLMQDESFCTLDCIRIKRGDPFGCSLESTTWTVTKSDESWQILKRKL